MSAGTKSRIQSRMAQYQLSAAQAEQNSKSQGTRKLSDSFEDKDNDFDKVEILFDANDLVTGFDKNTSGDRDRYQFPKSIAETGFLEGNQNFRSNESDGSDFYDGEEALDQVQVMATKIIPTINSHFDLPKDSNDHNNGFVMGTEESQLQNQPFSLGSLTNVPSSKVKLNSYVDYQMSSVGRTVNKKKPPVRKTMPKETSKNEKPGILSLDNDVIGEVGEWVGKSANVNVKNEDEDSEEEAEKRDQSDEFDAIFQEPRMKSQPDENKKTSGSLRPTSKEEQVGQINTEAFNAQSKIAMQKATQGSTAFRAAKNRTGPFLNNLKDKASGLKKTEELLDGDIKIKEEVEKGLQSSLENKAKLQQQAMLQEGKKEQFQEGESEEEDDDGENGVHTQTSGQKGIFTEEESQDRFPAKLPVQKQPNQVQEIQGFQLAVQKEASSPSPSKVVKEDEWDAISKATLQQKEQQKQKESINLVHFREVWEHMSDLKLAEEKRQVQKELVETQTFIQKYLSCLSSSLPAGLANERDLILALAKVPFSDDNPIHFEILQTIYIKLTGEVKEIPRFGSHWEKIGFQGRDPATDLRGVGILGLVQLLAFITYHEDIFTKMWKLSTDERHNFPLSICGFSMTQAVMEALRAGKINGVVIAKRSVINAFNEFYFATFYKLYRTYEMNSYTIQEYPLAKSIAIEALRSSPGRLLVEFHKDSTTR